MDPSLNDSVAAIVNRFEALSAVRDRALNEGRQIVRMSANSVRAIHRGEYALASHDLAAAKAMLNDLTRSLESFPAIYWAGYVQDAMKEFAEASLTLAVVLRTPLPPPSDLGVEDAPYLNALAEAASELRRSVLDTLRGEDLPQAEYLLGAMDEIYSTLVTVDFPDAITGGLRRTTDQLRAVLERTRGDLTVTINQRRLEIVLKAADPTFDGLRLPIPEEE